MRIALASPRIPTSVDDALDHVHRWIGVAAAEGAEIVCFPEAYVPGLRGQDFDVPPFGLEDQARVLADVAAWARQHAIATILGMEWLGDDGPHIVATVFDACGRVLGMQTKNQLDPTEESNYVPGSTRRMFEVNGVPFGVTICHEAWRYPETVRWHAVRGAKIVFQQQLTGSDRTGSRPTEWAAPESPYYEKAAMCRGLENTIFFASVNYATRFPDSATAVIAPTGACQAFLPYGEEGVLVETLDLTAATGLLARRFAPERYREG